MAIGGFIGVDNSARTIKDIFVGVDGVARRVIRAYVGDANGQARLWWDGGKSEVTAFVIFENGVFNYVPEGLDIENNIVDAKDYSESVPSGEDITINVLSDFYLTEKTFWIHDDGYNTAWGINNQLIDSNYLDHDNQPIINAIYIPINRISNPQKLKVTARGKNLQILCFYINDQSTEAANNYVEDSIITVENNELTNYIIDISGYSHIDYIRIGMKKFGEEEPEEEDFDTIYYEGDLTYFTSPIYAQLLQAGESILLDGSYITVTEGQAYIVQILPDSNSSLPDSEKNGYIILALSNEPFTVQYYVGAVHTNSYPNPRSFLSFVCYGGPLYGSGGYPSDTPLKDNYYKNFDLNIFVISDDIDSRGRSVVNELGKIIVAKINNNDTGSGQISMNFDPNKSLQQVSRIEIIGGTENSTPAPPEPGPTPILPDDWKTVQLAGPGESIQWKGANPDGTKWTECEVTVPENCYGCIAKYTQDYMPDMYCLIISKENFNKPTINKNYSNGGSSSRPFRYDAMLKTSQFIQNYYIAGETVLDSNSYSLVNVNFCSECKYSTLYENYKYGHMHGGSLLSLVEQN